MDLLIARDIVAFADVSERVTVSFKQFAIPSDPRSNPKLSHFFVKYSSLAPSELLLCQAGLSGRYFVPSAFVPAQPIKGNINTIGNNLLIMSFSSYASSI